MPWLTENERWQAIGMLGTGLSQSAVARRFGVAVSTICRQQQRHLQTGSVQDRPRPGQPRVTTAAQDRSIRTAHLRDRFRTATATANATPGRHNNRISRQTVLNRLRDHGIRARRAYVGPVLNDRRRRVRRNWAANHSGNRWPGAFWRRVLFSDESRFQLFRHDGRSRVFRRTGERFARPCVREVDRFGGGSVMVWGAIRFGWRSPLLIIEGNLTARLYAEIILEGQIIPYCTNDQRSIFMQDNARPHVAEICINLLRNNNVQTLEWPPYSSDMNPIEHLWDTLDRRVRARTPPPQSHAELRQALIEEWHRIPQWRINRLITSMPRRVNALAEARGAHTRY